MDDPSSRTISNVLFLVAFLFNIAFDREHFRSVSSVSERRSVEIQ